MQVSTKLFNAQSVARFSELSGDIQQIQTRIATGKNILKASDDPVAMVNISAAKEKQSELSRYATNIDRITERLGAAEITINEMQSILTRIYELSIQASNDTYGEDDRRAIQAEVIELRELLVEMANAKDANGNNLFAGFSSKKIPFKTNAKGITEFFGDQGRHSLPISETMMIPTGINGAEAFMRVKTGDGHTSLFKVIDELIQEMVEVGASSKSLENLNHSINHLSINTARIGVIINTVESQKALVHERKLLVTETLSGLEDADISSLVTKLQSLIVSQQAAQQTFVQIGRQTLFDFIR